MAEYIYSKFKEERLSGSTNISAHTFRALLVDLGASNLNVPAETATDPRLSDIDNLNKGGAGGNPLTPDLGVATFAGGVFDSPDNDTTFAAADTNVATSDTADGIVIYDDTHVNKRLMCVIDIGTTINFTGGDVVVDWDDLTSMNGQTGGIFAL